MTPFSAFLLGLIIGYFIRSILEDDDAGDN